MKSAETAVPSALRRPPIPATELAFPARSALPTLRALRERHFREGRHDLALQVALEVARRDPGRETFFKVGFLYREVGRFREALKSLRDALRFESGPKFLVPDIHLHTAFTWFLMRNLKRMGESLRRAYALRLKPRTAYNFHMTHGAHLLTRKDFSGAAREYARAEASATTAASRGSAATNRGIALHRAGLLSEARRPLDAAVRTLKRARQAALLAVARSVRASVCFDEGHLRRALGIYLRVAHAFHRMGKVDREAEVLVNAGYIAGEMGLWSKSRVILDRAIGLASTTGQYHVLAPAYACRASACAYHEDFEEAASNLAQSQRLGKGRRDWVALLHLCRAQARVNGLLGRWQDVFRAARHGERVASKVGDLARVAEFRKLRAAAEERVGRRKAAVMARSSATRVEALLNGPSRETLRREKITPRLAASMLPILLVGGETGGLIGLAREIHALSPRAKGPCEVVACEHLVFPASDLQGHVEGAWSGALRASLGQVARAQGGTIVFDRVDQLSREGQLVLLRIVDGKIRPVGAAGESAVDVRVIATCRNADGLLPDLRHRLEGAIIRLPALDDRKEEIVKALTDHLAGRRRMTPDAIAELAGQSWAGDLPQLRATVDRLVALSDSRIGRKLVRAVLMPSETRRVARRVDTVRASRQLILSAR